MKITVITLFLLLLSHGAVAEEWAFGRQKNVVLTLRALNHAVAKRRPPPGLIFHTDRGIEYYANAFRARLAQLRITQSMNRPSKVTDNAFMESFFHSMKAEVIHGRVFDEDSNLPPK